MPHYSNDGLQLHYKEVGSGPPLVLLHGFGQNGSAWDEALETYARHFRVIVPDMRGCGQSDTAPPGFPVRAVAADMVALFDHLGIERVHFAGWSLGGAVALELVLGWPERLITLSLHSTYAGGRTAYQSTWIAMRKQIILSGDQELDVLTRMIGFFSPEFFNEHPERIEEFRRRDRANLYRGTPEGLAGQNQAAAGHDVRDRLDRIALPTLITVGSADRTTQPAAAHLLHRGIRGSELVIFDNAGHFPAFQVRDEFMSVTLGFLIKHGGAEPTARK